MDAPKEASPHPGVFLSCAAIAQCLVVPYLVLAGMMAAEMSALLSVGVLASGVLTAVATTFLFRRRLWAWRLSSGLAALALVGGVLVTFVVPVVGAIHAVVAAAVLGALWAGRPAIRKEAL